MTSDRATVLSAISHRREPFVAEEATMSTMIYERSGPHLRIGQLAAEFGLNPKTIRYYEAIGLLPPPRRPVVGYRLYDAFDRERLRFIAKAKAVGLTLGEIGEILALRDGGNCPCAHVLELLDRKLAFMAAQLRALSDIGRDLTALRAEAATTARAGAPVCGIIEHHEPACPTRPNSTPVRNRRAAAPNT